MIRPLTLFWFLVAAAAVGTVFVVSHEVTQRERQLDHLRVEIQKSRDQIHVLRAEWAYLGRPQYLENLAAQYLDMAPIPPERIFAIDDLPFPGERPPETPENGKTRKGKALLAKAPAKRAPGAAAPAAAPARPAAPVVPGPTRAAALRSPALSSPAAMVPLAIAPVSATRTIGGAPQ